MTSSLRLRAKAGLAPVALGGWAAAIATAPDVLVKVLLAAPIPILAGAWWILLEPSRWLSVIFFSLILLPPLPIEVGNSGAHFAPLIAIVGIFGGLLRASEWTPRRSGLHGLMLLFPAIALASTALAAFYSGALVAAGSLARVFLLTIAVYVFFYTSIGPRRRSFDPIVPARWLYRFALAGAAFACVDFYFQLPAPSGFGAQYVWVDSGVFRRAQGLFYEASTLGNFCTFFLVMTVLAAFRYREERLFSRWEMAAGFLVFPGALVFSYSRASALNLVIAGVAYIYLRGLPAKRLIALTFGIGAAALATLRFALPQFFSHYMTRFETTFEYIQAAPNLTLSGRIATWQSIGEFLSANPWTAILGIGYKSLPYSHYAGAGLVADNTYLSLLVETGIVGLVVFLFLNGAILRTALRAARSPQKRASFFGAWIFCFWCGEVVQMLSGDLITYWRVLPLYFWVLATAEREAE